MAPKAENTSMTETFSRLLLADIAPEDVADTTPETLAGIVRSLWEFCEKRSGPGSRVRVRPIAGEKTGWGTDHAVVEIVNDDMPFLVDSVTGELNRQGYMANLVIHPVVHVARDKTGKVKELHSRQEDGRPEPLESWMHIRLAQAISADRAESLARDLEAVLADVRAAVEDWPKMQERAQAMAADMEKASVPLPDLVRSEAVEFLQWILRNNFTFLGCRDYRFGRKSGDDQTLDVVAGSGLGILREDSAEAFEGLGGTLSPDVRHFLKEPQQPVLLARTERRSTVHRTSPLDAILVKIFDDRGQVVGERLALGLFTSAASARSARKIPYVRQKVAEVVDRAGFDPRGHNGKALIHILETWPREELFHTSADDLFATVMGVLRLQDRQRTALFVRQDPFGRFVSCLVYIPRDRWSGDLRRRIQKILERAFDGKAGEHTTTWVSESIHVRVHIPVHTTPGTVPAVDLKDLERQIAAAARVWADALYDELATAHPDGKGAGLARTWGGAFPETYRQIVSPRVAVADIAFLEEVRAGQPVAVSLFRMSGKAGDEYRLKVFQEREAIPLSSILPILENLGLRVLTEMSFEVRPEGHETPVWIHEFSVAVPAGVDAMAVRDMFQDAFVQVWTHGAENDSLNRLVLLAGLGWRDVVLLRTFAKYLRQARLPYTQDTVADALAAWPEITRWIVRLFSVLHNPAAASRGPAETDEAQAAIRSVLKKVVSLDDDTILRRYVNLVNATLRTNFFQPAADGRPKAHVSIKLDSQAVDDLPLPRPWVEIFVYSPRVEAVHLRGGKVARGGIRWSDRREDFRTEVLGLMKAQMVKNTVIVPVGSKGGFVVKKLPPAEAGREAQMAEVVECYRTMVRGMLDITDNLVERKIVPPAHVVRRDGDDPYLVVAADKGTATFSDTANAISREYGFWMGDAFASGGSRGYDHKKMGITARGAWESVKRHFREMGHDTQTQDFTVMGVGDMSGDVFGNGMLQSRHIRLLGAFDHRHIFCDPSPDPAASYAERERMFRLPRSSWADYDTTKMSAGGAVFERSAKVVTLTPEIRQCFGIEATEVKPSELIRAMLKAPVDLLYFGGIGTFVKATQETHGDVGDKVSDPLRINGADIRARVVAEGANLGMTQAGRVEYGLKGGRLNTDAIDNSGGVDTSDHEVNIKIFLNGAVARGDLTLEQRDALLLEMTDEVAGLVLRDNYLQPQALSVMEANAADLLDQQARTMRLMEKSGLLERSLAGLPPDAELASRARNNIGLTRPEGAVLLAYGKIMLYDSLVTAGLPDDPVLAADLQSYFPVPMQKRFGKALDSHRLRREIVATVVTNELCNRMGASFVPAMMEKTGMGPEAVTRAWRIARDVFGLPALWRQIEALDLKVSAAVQIRMLSETQKLLRRAVSWFLLHGRHPLDIAGETKAMAGVPDGLLAAMKTALSVEETASLEASVEQLATQGVPRDVARQVVFLPVLAAAPEISGIARKTGETLATAATVYLDAGHRFGLDWMRNQTGRIVVENHWQRQAVSAMVDDLYALQGELTAHVLSGKAGKNAGGRARMDAWLEKNRDAVDRIHALLGELRTVSAMDLAMLAVAARQLRGLVTG
ncbi:MAG: NAD-glutamate dehydrogenase [Pseudomonadota bacterium]|nr:NAD-glutamate dehydrogenase [Pseudomonadota bacterium]